MGRLGGLGRGLTAKLGCSSMNENLSAGYRYVFNIVNSQVPRWVENEKYSNTESSVYNYKRVSFFPSCKKLHLQSKKLKA